MSREGRGGLMIFASEETWRLSKVVVLAGLPVAAGMLVASSGGTVALGLLGLATAILFFLRPEIGLIVAVATVPLENAFVISGFTGTRIVSAVALAAWLANRIVWRREWSSLVTSGFVLTSIAFIGFAFASVLWALEPNVATSGAIDLAQLFAWSIMIADLARSPAVANNLLRALVLSGAFAAFLTIQQYELGLRRAGEQIAGSVNRTATLLLTLVPLAFYLIRSERRLFWRLIGLIYVALAAAAIPVTFSRMNLMLLVAVMIVMCALTVVGGRGRGWIAALAIAVTAIGITIAPLDRIMERARSIGPYIESTLAQGPENPVTSGRGYHLRVGLAIARDHPIVGVGYSNYGYYFLRDYQFSVPGSDGLYYTPRSPHSSHVGILADLGIVGFALWIFLLFGIGIRYVGSAWLTSIRKRDQNIRFLAESILIAFGLHALPYALYLPNQTEKIFWLLLALTFAVYHMANTSNTLPRPRVRRPGSGTPADRQPPASGAPRSMAAVGAHAPNFAS